MTIYHFCCVPDARGIRKKGITEGAITYFRSPAGVPVMRKGWSWLTLDPDRERQSWNTHHLISYDRTECRFTIEWPDDQTDRLLDRDAAEEAVPGAWESFDGWAGSENWRVTRTPIPREWLVKLEQYDKLLKKWITIYDDRLH